MDKQQELNSDVNSLNSNDYVLVSTTTTTNIRKDNNNGDENGDLERQLNDAFNTDLTTLNDNNNRINIMSDNNDNAVTATTVTNGDQEANEEPTLGVDNQEQEQESANEDDDDDEEDGNDKGLNKTPRSLDDIESKSTSSLFFNITYLGCASVNAPKSENEINRIIGELNTQQSHLEVIMSIPNNVNDYIHLFDSQNQLEIAKYKMSQVLFVVRGQRLTTCDKCFAFTTCHGDSIENLIFPCHVFRCELNEAVNKILYSFWTVFKRQQMIKQQQQQHQQQQSNSTELSRTSSINSDKNHPQNDVISLNSFQTTTNAANSGTPNAFAERVFKYVNGDDVCNQYEYRVHVDIKEDTSTRAVNANNGDTPSAINTPSTTVNTSPSYTNVHKEKDYFKLRKNLDKMIYITIKQVNNGYSLKKLDIQRCFGVLLCAGRNCNVSDMQLLETKSMGNSGSGGTNGSVSSNGNGEYQICASWNPREPQYAILNEETQKNMKVFLTIAIDLVIDCVLEPIRFLIETKCRVYAQNEKFWSFTSAATSSLTSKASSRFSHQEIFYLQLKRSIAAAMTEDKVSEKETRSASISSTTSTPVTTQNRDGDRDGVVDQYNLHSIYSQTELIRKFNQIDVDLKKQKEINDAMKQQQSSGDGSGLASVGDDDDDDEDDLVFSGMGVVSKDFVNENELADWTELLSKWRKNYQERPRGLQELVHKGIPESLRGEIWQLLAGCHEDEKSMHESYRLLLYKESSCEQVILRDINRTFPGHTYFQDEQGQQSLYKLSKAYSIYDQEIGYCQGLSFLIATLLLHMPEEQSFHLLCKIMFNYKLRDIYKTNFESLHLRFYQFEQLLREYIPDLYEHFTDLNIETHMYASQWFLTLYTSKFPLYMVYRVIDLFLYHGFNILFTIGISLLKSSLKDLLALDFEGILKYFRVHMPKKYRQEENFQYFLDIWQKQVHFKISQKKLDKYEKMYELYKKIEKDKEDPQVRADKEIKQLQQQIRRLEQENDDLANEYINYRINQNKKLDQLQDHNEQLKLDLSHLKKDTQVKYLDYNDTINKYKLELDNIKQLYRNTIHTYDDDIKYLSTNNRLVNDLMIKLNRFYEYNVYCNDFIKSLIISVTSPPSPGTPANDDAIIDLINNFKSNQLYIDIQELDLQQREQLQTSQQQQKQQQNSCNGNDDDDTDNRVKQLELELARVKLELVNEKCLNQEYVHKIKQLNDQFQHYTSNTNLSGIGSGSTSSSNKWFNKTINQFKEATSQVVQKVNNPNK